MFKLEYGSAKASAALLLMGIAVASPGIAQDDVIVVPTRKGSKSGQVEKSQPKSDKNDDSDKSESKSSSRSASDKNDDSNKSESRTSRAASSKKDSASSDKKEKSASRTAKPADRKSEEPKEQSEVVERSSGNAEKKSTARSEQKTEAKEQPEVAERARSFLTNIGRKGDVFNTDYKTRPGSADIPSSLAGNGINGRNLPIGGEGSYRLAGMPDDYMPTDLVLIPKHLSYTGQPVYLRKPAADSFVRMASDAERQGLTIRIFSGFRDIKHQRRLYAEAVSRSGKNQKGVARPGKSEHMLGTTADVTSSERYLMKRSFAETPEGKWLAQHAPQYGWRMTVVRGEGPRAHVDEPWHIRYFGTGTHEMAVQPQRGDGIVKKAVKGIGKLFGLGRGN